MPRYSDLNPGVLNHGKWVNLRFDCLIGGQFSLLNDLPSREGDLFVQWRLLREVVSQVVGERPRHAF